MQIPPRSIANQEFSFSDYQRLKNSLINQKHFFESVITATDVAGTSATQIDGTEINGIETDFVLMRSPTLSVLLTATPLASSSPVESAAAFTDGASIPSMFDTDTSLKRALFSDDRYHQPLNSSSSLQRQPNLRHVPTGERPDSGSSLYQNARSGLLHMHSPKTKKIPQQQSEQPHYQKASHQTSHQKADRYRVSLTVSSSKIEEFMAKLTSDSTLSWATKPERSIQPTGQPQTCQSQTGQSQTSKSEAADKESTSHLSADTFFLAWAKEFAASPDGNRQSDRPATPENETERSLLLNQVITRIRHSLDLPSILETTVAQVREFLSADRLVLYQFTPTGEKTPDAVSDQAGRSNIKQTSDALTKPIVGQRVQAGHVTYESRLSEDISSVLNFAEESCFRPCLDTYSRYLLGQPIAVDNVDRQYAHAGCLLNFLHKAQIKSKIIAPIIIKGQLWGLLIAHQCKAYRHWQETETVFLQHIAEHLAVAIEQASLYHQLRRQKVSLESCVIERTQSLKDALSAAASADRTKGEFLSTMSHELRTPLTYIIGMSATLLRWPFGELNERQRSYLATINHSGEQLLTVINDILEFAKVESGRSLLNISDFSLSDLVRSVADRHQAMAQSHDVALAVECALSSELATFRADPQRIGQLLANLLNNAIKFTPAGGQVTVRVRKELNSVLLQVEDSGVGIPESQKKFLFEKFKQLESPFQRQHAGTGLGLAMTKHLVELHGGNIQVSSTVGEGSTFTVGLPIRSQQPLDTRYQVPSTLEQTTKPVVLLLETEENSAAIICELLSADGYEIIWLTPEDDVAVQLTLLKPTLLIADLSLLSHRPDQIKTIEQSITVVGTRVLALLSQPSSQSSHIAHHDTLDKPIDPQKLIEKSRQLTAAYL